jgi:acyl-CoA thioester hydrolase
VTPTVFESMPRPATPVPSIEAPAEAFWCGIVVGEDGVSRGVPHVNNAEYVRFIDRIAERATDAAGFTRARMLAEDRMWFVARHEIDYRGETFAGDRLVAATWLTTWTRTTVVRETRIARIGDGRLVCVASTRWAYVDLTSRRPARIPSEMRHAFPDLVLDPPQESGS